MAAKAYRLLRAIMTTAVDEDNMLPRNPCWINGAGDEDAAERPVLTVRQVFELAERVGRRPVGNIREMADGYRLRFSRNGEMHTSPERYATRQEAERALWKMADDGRADCTHDRRFYALVLLPPSPVFGGARQRHSAVAIWTWKCAPSGSGPRTSSGQPVRCC